METMNVIADLWKDMSRYSRVDVGIPKFISKEELGVDDFKEPGAFAARFRDGGDYLIPTVEGIGVYDVNEEVVKPAAAHELCHYLHFLNNPEWYFGMQILPPESRRLSERIKFAASSIEETAAWFASMEYSTPEEVEALRKMSNFSPEYVNQYSLAVASREDGVTMKEASDPEVFMNILDKLYPDFFKSKNSILRKQLRRAREYEQPIRIDQLKIL